MRVIGLLLAGFLSLFSVCGTHQAYAGILFGSGPNQFNMDFVLIGSPGNLADTTGSPNPAGAVGYNFQMGTYEVSRDMITKANAVGSLGITLADMSSFGGNGADQPATSVSWNETEFDLVNNLGSSNRVIRGGNWATGLSFDLSSSARFVNNPAVDVGFGLGFRVASLSSSAVVPEPGSLAIWGMMCMSGLLYGGRRMRK